AYTFVADRNRFVCPPTSLQRLCFSNQSHSHVLTQVVFGRLSESLYNFAVGGDCMVGLSQAFEGDRFSEQGGNHLLTQPHLPEKYGLIKVSGSESAYNAVVGRDCVVGLS